MIYDCKSRYLEAVRLIAIQGSRSDACSSQGDRSGNEAADRRTTTGNKEIQQLQKVVRNRFAGAVEATVNI